MRNSAGRIVGLCYSTNSKDEKRVNAIYVLPEYQGKGVEKMLMSEALQWIGDDETVYLNVATFNEKAIGFYRRFGFETTRNMPEEFRDFGGKMKVIPETEMVRKGK
ncbi:MAG: GNAT family N-acetyltransferase [bacterium]